MCQKSGGTSLSSKQTYGSKYLEQWEEIVVLANLIARTQFIFTQSGNVSVNEVFETNRKNGIFCI